MYTYRLRYAQKRRDEQLLRYQDYDAAQNGIDDKHKNDKSVKFGDSITLLEACARNDYDEGNILFLVLWSTCPLSNMYK